MQARNISTVFVTIKERGNCGLLTLTGFRNYKKVVFFQITLQLCSFGLFSNVIGMQRQLDYYYPWDIVNLINIIKDNGYKK